MEHYSLPAKTIHAKSHMTFPAFDFSIISYMRLLFQLQCMYCFLGSTSEMAASGKTTANVSCSKTFLCRDPGDTTSKVSCCVKPS